jgi:hypothetical protein
MPGIRAATVDRMEGDDVAQFNEQEANTLRYLHKALDGAKGTTREEILDRLIDDARKDIIVRAELVAAINAAIVKLPSTSDGSGVAAALAELVKRIENG